MDSLLGRIIYLHDHMLFLTRNSLYIKQKYIEKILLVGIAAYVHVDNLLACRKQKTLARILLPS